MIYQQTVLLMRKLKLFWKITNNFNENLNLNYEFSINHDLDKVLYNSLEQLLLKIILLLLLIILKKMGQSAVRMF